MGIDERARRIQAARRAEGKPIWQAGDRVFVTANDKFVGHSRDKMMVVCSNGSNC